MTPEYTPYIGKVDLSGADLTPEAKIKIAQAEQGVVDHFKDVPLDNRYYQLFAEHVEGISVAAELAKTGIVSERAKEVGRRANERWNNASDRRTLTAIMRVTRALRSAITEATGVSNPEHIQILYADKLEGAQRQIIANKNLPPQTTTAK